MDDNQTYAKMCPKCANIKDYPAIKSLPNFYKGFTFSEETNRKYKKCPYCQQENLVDSIMTFYELQVIRFFSDHNRQIRDEMIELKQKNLEQYQVRFKIMEDEVEKIHKLNRLRSSIKDKDKKETENVHIKFCPSCNSTSKNVHMFTKSFNYSLSNLSDFDRGFLYWFDEESNSDECPCCGTKGMTDSVITRKEFDIIKEVSNSNRQLLELMIELKQKDPIEFQLKFGQFEFQLQQKQLLKKQEEDLKKQQEELQKQKEEDNKPKCPHCKSTDIKKISFTNRTVSIVFWGPFSKKINKSFQCRDCGYTW